MEKVYVNKSECSGCNTCSMVCPTHSISMAKDDNGFLYPRIDQDRCIDCKKCVRSCPMIQNSGQAIESAYAVRLLSKDIDNSASGGAFFALAKAFLEDNGIVYGCAFNEELTAKHIMVERSEDLRKLQGSKYVQSYLDVHADILNQLNAGRKVLFSGTPCQVAAIKSFVGEYPRLFTIEIVCHGVPNDALWKDYIQYLENEKKGKITDFHFRAKNTAIKFCAQYSLYKNGKEKEYTLPSVLSYYYYGFLKGKIYRDSCYSCPYAKPNRQADVTICDYWGYQGKLFKGKTDISALLIQGEKGKNLFELGKKYMEAEETSFSQVAANNEQLIKPSDISKYDDGFFECWKKNGAKALDKEHRRKHWKAYLLNLFHLLK